MTKASVTSRACRRGVVKAFLYQDDQSLKQNCRLMEPFPRGSKTCVLGTSNYIVRAWGKDTMTGYLDPQGFMTAIQRFFSSIASQFFCPLHGRSS